MCYTCLHNGDHGGRVPRLTVDEKAAGSKPADRPFDSADCNQQSAEHLFQDRKTNLNLHLEMKRNKIVSGMPVGTAQGRLRKLVMFDLIQKLNLDTCYRCGKKIESVEELSLDHKQSWLDQHELFWDLENIAFSHLLCNSLASDRSGPRERIKSRKIGPPGTAWCQGHQAFLPVENFYNHKNHWNGLDLYCKNCKKTLWKK